MKNKIITTVALSLLASSCAEHKRIEPVRTVKEANAVTAVTASPKAADVQALLQPLQPLLEHEAAPKACERLEQLGKEPREGKETFSYLGYAGMNGESPVGHIELKESPFSQFILGESFKVDDFDTFFEKARKEYEAGRLSGAKWLLLKTMKATGFGQRAQFSATNDKLAEKFPGIFGEQGALEASLPFGLAQRAAMQPLKADPLVAKILTTKIPLFSGDGTWAAHVAATRLSIGAAARAFREAKGRSNEEIAERLCGTVLLHQNFAQLLRIKGMNAPVIIDGPGGRPSRIEKLSTSAPEFAKKEVPGAIFDLIGKKFVRLENESIKKYEPKVDAADPAKSMLYTVSDKVPGQATQPGMLGDSLAFMDAILYGYEASCPVADPAKTRYLFGDIAAENSTAVLPAEVHSLSLGLLTMQLKNAAGLHLKKVNAKGTLLAEGEKAAGLLVTVQPLPPGAKPGVVNVRLADAVRLTKIALFLESGLLRLKAMDPAKLKAMNDVYSPETIATLEALRAKLVEMKFPMVLLMSQLATPEKGCVSEMEWNLETGARKPLAQCSKEEMLAAADVFELMARDSQAPLLLKKVEELRKQAQ